MPFSYEYSPVNGALAAVEYPNGVVSERGYDVMDRLSLIGWSGYDSADADTRQKHMRGLSPFVGAKSSHNERAFGRVGSVWMWAGQAGQMRNKSE